jgi:phosphopentomutase
MKRAIILVLDSLGLGSSDDAHLYGDQGSDTFGHIIEACDSGKANNSDRSGPLKIPNLLRWGLGEAAIESRGSSLPIERVKPEGAFGFAKEISAGKDTPVGTGKSVVYQSHLNGEPFQKLITAFQGV